MCGAFSKQEVRRQLERILESDDFSASKRLKDFLVFIVEATLSGKADELKAYKIALDVFGLDPGFDPNINPVVRTEAGRLRSKLDHYYLRNPDSEIFISIPKGAYGAAFSRHPPANDSSKSNLAAQSIVKPALSLSDSTILMLPLTNVNKSERAEYFINCLVNEVNTVLTKYSELNVIDYHRSLQLGIIKDAAKNIIADTQARFVLSGSVQLDKNVYKIWLNLGDTRTNYSIWAEKFEGVLSSDDFFEVHEQIAENIVYNIADDFGLINRTLLSEYSNGKHGPSSLETASLLYYKWTTEVSFKNFEKALSSVEQALEKHPGNTLAQAMLADLYASDYQWSYNLVENGLKKSLELAISALNSDPECQIAYLALALNYFLRRDVEKFDMCAQRALEINPKSGNTLAALSTWYGLLGVWDKALELTGKIVEYNPACPGWCHATLALYHYIHKEYGKALTEAKKVNMPYTLWDPLIRLVISTAFGRKQETNTAIEDLLIVYPEFREKGFEIISRNVPSKEVVRLLCESLKKAGLEFKNSCK